MILFDTFLVELGIRFGPVQNLTEKLSMVEEFVVAGPSEQTRTVVTRITEGEEGLGVVKV